MLNEEMRDPGVVGAGWMGSKGVDHIVTTLKALQETLGH